jgi:uracil-DNA glycosylase
MSNIEPQIHDSWKQILTEEFNSDYFSQLKSFLVQEKQQHKVFPSGENIFKAFDLTPFDKVKVVILGQDPYHGDHQAHGLSFSVPEGIAHPPSLVNIFKELKNDLNIDKPKSGNLEAWAKEGVLLLNATLTVRAHQAGSHQNKGWETFTDAVIKKLADEKEQLVFILWGNYAQKKGRFIDANKHYIIKAVHPSPLSANRGGFFGSQPFSKTNNYLKSKNIDPIDWTL